MIRRYLQKLGMAVIRSRIAGVSGISVYGASLVCAIPLYYFVFVYFLRRMAERADDVLPGAFAFTRFVFNPNPYVREGYLAGYIIIPLIAYVIFLCIRAGAAKGVITAALLRAWPYYALSVALGATLFKALLHVLWLPVWQQFPQKGDLKVQLLLLLSAAVAYGALRTQTDVLGVIHRYRTFPWKRHSYLVLALIAAFVFSPDFIYSHSHYDYFVSAVNDLRHGKVMLVDTMNQYGLLNTFFLFGVFEVVPVFSYPAFSFLFALVYAVWYGGWYLFIRRWLGSDLLALAGVLAMIVFLHIPPGSFDLLYGAPQVGPFRELFVLPVACLVLWVSRRGWSVYFPKALLYLVSALGFFWFSDAGLSLVAAVAATTVYALWAQGMRPFKKIAAEITLHLGTLFAAIAVLGALYSTGARVVTGVWPSWFLTYRMTGLFARGLFSIPLPYSGFYYVVVLLFLGTGLFILWQSLTRTSEPYLVPAFFVLYGVIQFSYYVSRADPMNLSPRYAYLLALLAVWWVWHILRLYEGARANALSQYSHAMRGLSASLAGALFFFVVYGGFIAYLTFRDRSYRTIRENFARETIGTPEVDGGNRDILDDITTIRADYADVARPAFVHWYDTKILMDLDKTNFFGPFYYHLLMTESDVDVYIAKAKREQPAYLFIGRDDAPAFQYYSISSDKLRYFRERIEDQYARTRRLKTIDVYRLVRIPNS